MELKQRLYDTAGIAIRRANLYNFISIKEDTRPDFPYKLVYMCGREGERYLNASLASIYLNWSKLPEVVVVSDGTPLTNITKWPLKLDVISWEEAYAYYQQKGNEAL